MDFDELSEDNGKEIYYDKKYDDTRYDIITEYKGQQDTMSEEEFLRFLVAELQMNVGMKERNAIQEAEALIKGQRKVEDGDYAVLETFDGEGNMLYYLYKRNNDMWELDESKTTNDDVKMQSYFCVSQDRCLSTHLSPSSLISPLSLHISSNVAS